VLLNGEVFGKVMACYDDAAALLWMRARAIAAAAAPDGTTRVFDKTTVDECTEAPVVSNLDATGSVVWRWAP
jgi:hypothetical protein